MNSLIYPPYSTSYDSYLLVLDVKVFYRLLKISSRKTKNIEKLTIRDLIKTTITEQNQNKESIVDFLESQLKIM